MSNNSSQSDNPLKPLLSSPAPISLSHALYTDKLRELAACGQSRHLDIGAGTGENVRLSTQLGLSPIAVEYDADYARCVSSPVVRSSAVPLPFCDNSFNVVTLMHVLEHVSNYMDVLEEIRRVLASNGCLIIEVPNKYSLQELLNLVYGRLVFREARKHLGHCNFFTHRRLQQCLLDAGFQIEDCRVWGGPLHGTTRSIVDLSLRLLFKTLLHRGKRDRQDNQKIAVIHECILPVYKLLLRADRYIERATLLLVEGIGFVARASRVDIA